MKNIQEVKYNPIIAIILVLYAAIPILPAGVNSFYLFVIFPALFVLSFLQYPKSITDNKVYRYYIAYFIFSIITIVFAEDSNLSLNSLRFYAGAFVITCVYTNFSSNHKYINKIYLFFFIYLLANLLLGYTLGFASIDVSSERAGNEQLNANRYGYFVFILTFVSYYLGEVSEKGKIWRIMFFLSLPLSFFIAIMSASRQVLLIQIPFISILVLKRYLTNSKKHTIPVIVFGLLFVFIAGDRVMNIYENSLLFERSQKELADDHRTVLLKKAIEVGNSHFLTGVGYANFRRYSVGMISHNSYAEAYAEGGIIQLLLFVAMLGAFCRNQYRRYRQSKNGVFMTFFITGVFYAAFSMFYVFQEFSHLMIFLFVMENDSRWRYQQLKAQST